MYQENDAKSDFATIEAVHPQIRYVMLMRCKNCKEFLASCSRVMYRHLLNEHQKIRPEMFNCLCDYCVTQPNSEIRVPPSVSSDTNTDSSSPSDTQSNTGAEKSYYYDPPAQQSVYESSSTNDKFTKARVHKCKFCIKRYVHKCDLSRHNLKYHRTGGYKCPICERLFSKLGNLNRHKKTHTGVDMFKCAYCEKSYMKKCHWLDHMKEHSTRFKYSCPYCESSFKLEMTLRNHISQYHKDNARRRNNINLEICLCQYCFKLFTSKAELHEHVKLHSGSSGKMYKCSQCYKRFTWPSALYRHRKNIHKLHQGEWKCKYCNTSFILRRNLLNHGCKVKPREVNDTFKCGVCGKMFPTRSSEINHTKKHHMCKGMFKCPYCNLLMRRKSNLRNHVESIHKAKLKRFFSCEFCLKSFPLKGSVVRHAKTCDSALKLGHRCDKCGKCFTKKESLISHGALHNGNNNNFKCKVCGRVLRTEGHLNQHMKQHLNN